MTDEGVRHLYGPAEAERPLGIKASTIRSWARRGLIHAYGLDEAGRPLFDRDDLVRLRDRKRRPRVADSVQPR